MRTRKYIEAKRRACEFFEVPKETPVAELVDMLYEQCRVVFDKPDNKLLRLRLIYAAFAVSPPRRKTIENNKPA